MTAPPCPVSHLILTHAHPDHVLGNAAFRDTAAAIVAHARLTERLAEAGPYYLASMRRLLGAAFAGTELVPPTATVEDRSRSISVAGCWSCAPGLPPTRTPI